VASATSQPKKLSICQAAVDDQALFPIIHSEGAHSAAAINSLKPELTDSKTVPVVEF